MGPKSPSTYDVEPPALALSALTIGMLDRHLSIGHAEMLVPTDLELGERSFVLVDLTLGAAPYRATLSGEVMETAVTVPWPHDKARVARVRLTVKSWERLRSLAMWLPWRRGTDFDTEAERTRMRVKMKTECYAGDTIEGFAATIADVSDHGAYLAVGIEVERGDIIWFRPNDESPWHCATVLWRGHKYGMAGIGVSLDFDVPQARDLWSRFLTDIRHGGPPSVHK